MKLVNIAKKFAKPISFGAAGIAALGIAISSVLNRNDEEDDYDDYEPDEDSDDYESEPEETPEESAVDDAE